MTVGLLMLPDGSCAGLSAGFEYTGAGQRVYLA